MWNFIIMVGAVTTAWLPSGPSGVQAAVFPEAALISRLLGPDSGYSTRARPVPNPATTITVGLEFELASIFKLDETEEVIKTVGFLVAEWEDAGLTWSPADHGGLESIVLPPGDVWLPDIGIGNSADSFFRETFTRDFRVDVHNTGQVIWKFGGSFSTACPLVITYYPFDRQRCTIEVETWAYTDDLVDLQNLTTDVHLQEFQVNGEWELTGSSAERVSYVEDSHPDKLFPRVVFGIELRRKPAYYILNIIVPCMFCVTIALLVFWLPPESGEKVSLGITVLLAFSVFNLVVTESTPRTSETTPMLSVLMIVIMGFATVSILTSVLVLYLYHRGGGPDASLPPSRLQDLMFKHVARLVCMKSEPPNTRGSERRPSNKSQTVFPSDTNVTVVEDLLGVLEADVHGQKHNSTRENHNAPGEEKEPAHLQEMRAYLRLLARAQLSRERDDTVADTWRHLALITDRLFFWIVFIISVIVVPVFLTLRP